LPELSSRLLTRMADAAKISKVHVAVDAASGELVYDLG